ncbi:MAG: hypothetical protein JOZ19_08610, partial [Rubrobacter sp.]|nr:hypothetical protein [Rubrobacter sp.]
LDYFIIGVYFLFVPGIGAVLRNKLQTSEDYSGLRESVGKEGFFYLWANTGGRTIQWPYSGSR